MEGDKVVPLEEARKLVLEYLKKRQECMTNDIIRDLELDRVLVLKVPFLGKVPIDPQICEDSDRGTPFITEHMDSPATKAFMEIVKKIEDFLKTERTQPSKVMKEEVEELKEGNPRFNSMIDGIIQEIEKYQTARYRAYIKRYYDRKISEITAMISRLKAFMST